VINKSGRGALTNFALSEYDAEVDALQRMALPDLVATLRSKARACACAWEGGREGGSARRDGAAIARAQVAVQGAPAKKRCTAQNRSLARALIISISRPNLTHLPRLPLSQARRHGAQTSSFRGVSLLKQTGKWHAQINVAGKQLHLGFFASEAAAARAYDRAAIHKAGAMAVALSAGGAAAAPGAGTTAPASSALVPITNFELGEYENEIEALQRMDQAQLLALLAEHKASRADDGGAGGSGSGGGSAGRGGSGGGLKRRRRGGSADGAADGSADGAAGGSGSGGGGSGGGGCGGSSGGSGSGSAGALAPRLPDIYPRGKGRRTRRRPCQAPSA
jgi:hypothetical protein